MRLTRNHIDAPLAEGMSLVLPENTTAHLTRVLRLAVGARFVLFNGDGCDYEAQLLSLAKKGAEAQVLSRREVQNESSLRITLAQAVARGEKMDLILQKATELGVAGFAPLLTERTEVKLDAERGDKRLAHWRGVVASACEQSGRARIPSVAPPLPLANFLTQKAMGRVIHFDPDADASLRDVPLDETDLALVIGPEGGLGERDLAQLRSAGALGVRLGPRILRTETAGLAALAAVQALRGDL